MNRALPVLYAAALIDTIGLGLIVPVMPTLLRGLTHGPVSLHYGSLVATFALTQFVFAPILGALSDRWGRRPILLLSLAGGALDYLLTGFAPALWVVYLSRLLAGLTAANIAVISAMIADLTPEQDRARRFAGMNGAFGLGLIIGPVLGGTLGQVSTVLPFLMAAGLNGLNFLVGLVLLREPERPATDRPRLPAGRMNTLASLRWLTALPAMKWLLAIFVTMCLLSQIPITLWVLYCQARYGWSTSQVGWSFACFGLLFALSQILLAGPLTRRLGGRGSLVACLGLDVAGTTLMGFANRGWMAFAIMPLLTAGSVGTPALQGAISGAVEASRQGELQGTLSSIASLTGVIGPILVTAIFEATQHRLPGAIYLAAAAGYAFCAILAIWPSRGAARA